MVVSIHAPTRGATSSLRCWYIPNHVSIHAPTRGATYVQGLMSKEEEFQSTHPHGVRLTSLFDLSETSRFNPRTHTGCDGVFKAHRVTFNLFQSTHPHGVRPDCGDMSLFQGVSIHAPTRGATYNSEYMGELPQVSIHAPTRGATFVGCKERKELMFQSTHPHGVRRFGSFLAL